MSTKSLNRKLHFLKSHQQLEPEYYSTVPPGSSITFTVPYGAYGFGTLSQNVLGIPSIYHNGQSDPKAVVKAMSKKRSRDNVLTLLKRNTGIRPVVYEAGNTIPASWVINNNQYRTTFHSNTPFQLKTTRSGTVFNRGRVPKNPVTLANVVNKQPGNYIVHACRFVPKDQRGRCERQQKVLQMELTREYKNRRNTLRGIQNRQGNYGNSVPLKINSTRKSLRRDGS